MKNEYSDQIYDDKDFFSESEQQSGYPEHEIGIAINEHDTLDQPEAKATKDPFERDDEDFLFSSHDKDEQENEEEEEEEGKEEEGKEEGNLAYAESSKERLIDKLKSNMIYIFIALVLIVPAVFKLYNMVFGEAEVTSSQTAQNATFTETKAPPTVTEKVPSVAETTETETKVQPKEENAARSAVNKAPSIGGGSAEISANMPINEEKMNAPSKEAVAETESKGGVASILGIGKKETGGEQILDRFFAEESKVEQQLSEILGKMDDIEARLATLDDMDKRLTALEENSASVTQSAEGLQQLSKRLTQLEQNMNQLQQQVKRPPVAPVVKAPAAVGTQQGANVSPSAVSVEAVIPGRAWLRTPDGVLMVVEVGDEIPGVGKVTRIDAREGIVATTTQVFKQ